VPNWKDLSPRVGATYDVFGDGKTILRGAYNRYVASESTNMATLNNRVNTSINSATRNWTDTNGNFVPDCNLANTLQNGECGQLSAPLGSLNVAATYDSAITSGFGVRPNDQEIAAGFQQQLMPRLALDFQFTRHAFGNFLAAYNSTRPPSAYQSFCVTAPPDARLPNGGGNQICGFEDLNPAFFSTVPFFQVQKATNFGDATDVYTGYDLNANARLPRGGVVSGGFSMGHEVTDICAVAGQASVTYAGVAGVLASSAGTIAPAFASVATPSTLFCHVQPPYQADVKGFASYPLPWWGLNASATLQNRPGPQISASYTVTAAQVQNLGRPLGTSTATTALIAPGTMYGSRVTQLDARIGKNFRLQRYRVLASIDVFNLLNSSAVLSQNNTYGSSWLSPTQILQGRLVKFGMQFEF
jgi:hypothetical protein